LAKIKGRAAVVMSSHKVRDPQSLEQMKAINVGMTRQQLLRVFTLAGGSLI
jgi:hypothetical protein